MTPTDGSGETVRPDELGGGPEGPSELSRRSWKAILVRTAKEFQRDNLTDWAAALTYYAVLALFPALIVLVSLLGLFGQYPATFDALLDIVRSVAPASAVETFEAPLREVIEDDESAGLALVIGLGGAIFSASGYVGAFMRVSNAIYEVQEGRPFWKLRPLQIGVTLLVMVLIGLVGVALVVSGPLAEAIGGVLGLSGVAVLVWSIVKWPLMLVVVAGMFATLYWVAPNVQPPRFRWFTPGGTVAVLAWILASVLFGIYVANFSSYDKTYGSIGGIIGFLVWVWISNLALLFGAEMNAEVERERELESGLPAEKSLQLPPRQDPHPPAKDEGDAGQAAPQPS